MPLRDAAARWIDQPIVPHLEISASAEVLVSAPRLRCPLVQTQHITTARAGCKDALADDNGILTAEISAVCSDSPSEPQIENCIEAAKLQHRLDVSLRGTKYELHIVFGDSVLCKKQHAQTRRVNPMKVGKIEHDDFAGTLSYLG